MTKPSLPPASKLTPEVQAQIIEALKAGNFRYRAASAGGVTLRTLQRWMKAQPDFKRAVLEAEHDAEATALRVVLSAGPKDWKAAAWFLERKFPNRWGRRDPQRLELTGKDGAPLELLHGLTDEERARRIAELLQLGAGGGSALPEHRPAPGALAAAGSEEKVAAVAGPADGGPEQSG